MKTKIIPFDLETAKKIQAGEIKGKILDALKNEVRIVCFDREDAVSPIIALFKVDGGEGVMYVREDGHATNCRDILGLEVPEEAPKHKFKPFDKVLGKSNSGEWVPDMYSRMTSVGRYICLGGIYEQIIPYEGNQELVGTCNEPKEK